MTLDLAMVAGEASGDLLAGLLLKGLRARWPELHAHGIGGPAMAREGFHAQWPSERLAVRGYVEVFRHFPDIWSLRQQLLRRLTDSPPKIFVGVDAPDFNLGLERRLRHVGIKTVHFVCPSIWAWRGGRVKRLSESTDHVLCLFPFEPELLRPHGLRATYVGHPLADVIPMEPPREAARRSLGLKASDTVIALLPGSRRSEMDYIAKTLFQAAALLDRQQPGAQFVVPVAPGLRAQAQAILSSCMGPRIQLVEGRSHEVLAACDLTLIASGTATLEAALFKRPMVVAYKMHPLTWQMMKRMAYQPWVSLPNILARDFLVPELIQEACTPQALATQALAWLDEPSRRAQLHQTFCHLHRELRRDTARCAADAIAQELES
mgnify:FL=1